MTRRIRHGGVELALHELKDGNAPTLLCIHELEGRAEQWRDAAQTWLGAAVAVDLAGHGDSDWLAGGGYTPERFAADADMALAAVSASGPVVVVGAGIGAYVALLLAGSRPDAVAVAGLLPGRGLDGGGAHPTESPHDPAAGARLFDIADRGAEPSPAHDPLVELCLGDLRPPDYAAFFAATARALVLGDIGDAGDDRPPWWREVRGSERATTGPSDRAGMIGTLARRPAG